MLLLFLELVLLKVKKLWCQGAARYHILYVEDVLFLAVLGQYDVGPADATPSWWVKMMLGLVMLPGHGGSR